MLIPKARYTDDGPRCRLCGQIVLCANLRVLKGDVTQEGEECGTRVHPGDTVVESLGYCLRGHESIVMIDIDVDHAPANAMPNLVRSWKPVFCAIRVEDMF